MDLQLSTNWQLGLYYILRRVRFIVKGFNCW